MTASTITGALEYTDRCLEGWKLFDAWVKTYREQPTLIQKGRYELALDTYRLHNKSCEQCRRRTGELTAQAKQIEYPPDFDLRLINLCKTLEVDPDVCAQTKEFSF